MFKINFKRLFHLTGDKRIPLLMFYCDSQYPQNVPWFLYWPSGILYRVPFRYHSRYLVKNCTDIKKSTTALICTKFLRLEEEDENVYIPIREVSITKTERFAEHYFYYLKVGRFVDFIDNAKFSYYNELINKSLKRRDKGKLVIKAELDIPFVEKDTYGEEKSWENLTNFFLLLESNNLAIVEKVSNMLQENTTRFLYQKFLGIYKGKKRLYPVKLSKGLDCFGFRLKQASEYEIRVFQYYGTKKCKVPKFLACSLHLALPSDMAFKIKAESQIIGNYDEHRFLFRTKEEAKGSTYLRLGLKDGQSLEFEIPATREKLTLSVPDLIVPIKVVRLWKLYFWRKIFPIVLFVVGSLCEIISIQPELKFLKVLETQIGVPLFTLLIIGLLLGLTLQALAIYFFGFRK